MKWSFKFSLPLILIALALAIIWGASIQLLMGLLAFLIWGSFARQVRGEALVLKETDYVKLARVAGASTTRILHKHIFPGVMNTVGRSSDISGRIGNLGGSVAEFLGRRYSTTNPCLGVYGIGWAALHHNRLVGYPDTGTCDCSHGDSLYAAGRLDPG